MYIVLTDILTCPRCGPEFGLIVLADEIEERRVVRGMLGCANCREQYPIAGRVADLRVPSRMPSSNGNGGRPDDGDPRHLGPSAGEPGSDVGGVAGTEAGDEAERGYRVAALLGVGQGAGPVLIDGRSAEIARRVGELLPNAVVVGAGRAPVDDPPGPGWVIHGRSVPFRDRSLRAAALLDGTDADLVRDAARTVVPGGRIVLDPAPAGGVDLLADAGLDVILDQDGVVVASAL